MWPTGKSVADAGLQITGSVPSTVSLADVAKVTTIPEAELAWTLKSAGTVITGAVVSRMLTSKVVVAVLRALSWLVQVTVVWPSAKVVPERGAQVTVVVPLTVSAAVGRV